ncbi:hypothetical protein FRC12_022520 [Ceratobasidium sp. 428]|nr:hypothetical protein FRC12_022520 [Ceratobasidium sp. 428]
MFSIKLDHSSSSRPSSLSSGSRQSSINSSVSSSRQVTWGKNSILEFTTAPAIQRKDRLSFNSFKRKLLRFGSKDNLKRSSNRPPPSSHKTLHGILKPPTRFVEPHIDPGFDWSALANDLPMRAPVNMNSLPPVPPLLPTMDDEETPISSTVSTPPLADTTCDHWETASDYFSDQWDVTPKLLSEWDYPIFDNKPLAPEQQVFHLVPPSPNDHPGLYFAETPEQPVEPSQPPNEPIQTPGDFIDGLASSLQHTLAVCGIGFFIFSFLIIWTTVLLTCGIMIASVAPAVLLAYWLLHLITRVKYSFEQIVLTTIKIGGLLGLGIGFSVLVLIDLLMDEIESIAILVSRSLPTLTVIGLSMTGLYLLLGSNIYDLIAHNIGFLLSI